MATVNDYLMDDLQDDESSNWNNTECIPFEIVFEPSVMDRLEFQMVMGFFYFVIWMFGTTSNLLVLYVVINESRRARPWATFTARRRRASSVTHSAVTSAFFSVRFVFVASLSCADLLTAWTSLPVTSINFFTRQWIFSTFICHVIGVFQGISIFQSSFTLTSIAIDRYMLIVYPNRNFMTKRRATASVVATAVLSLILAFPLAFFVKIINNPEFVEGYPPLCGSFCVEAWPGGSTLWDERVYGTIVLVLQFGLPVVVTSVCYWRVACRLSQLRVNRRRSELIMTSLDARRQSTSDGNLTMLNGSTCCTGRRQRTNRMMLSMVVAFAVSWSPHNILNLLRDFGWTGHFHGTQIFPTLYAVAHLIGMTTLIWNPIMYAWFNRPIREALKMALCWRR